MSQNREFESYPESCEELLRHLNGLGLQQNHFPCGVGGGLGQEEWRATQATDDGLGPRLNRGSEWML